MSGLLRGLAALVLGVVALAGLALVAFVTLIAWAFYLDSYRFDRDQPDYRYVKGELAKAGGRSIVIDAARINGGDWHLLCVFGPYSNPERTLKEQADLRGLRVTTVDVVPRQQFGVTPVEERESAVSYIDGAGRGRTILIDDDRLGVGWDHSCFGRDVSNVFLPLRNDEAPQTGTGQPNE